MYENSSDVFTAAVQEGLNLSCSGVMSDANSLPDLRSGSVSAVLLLTNQDQVLHHYVRIYEEFFFLSLFTQFQALPYMNSMTLSDPSLIPLGSAAVTPKQQAQAREMLMNSSMMYMHQVKRIYSQIGLKKKNPKIW